MKTAGDHVRDADRATRFPSTTAELIEFVEDVQRDVIECIAEMVEKGGSPYTYSDTFAEEMAERIRAMKP